MFLDWTNWTFWVTALALIAFGFNLRVIYEQWRFWKIRKRPDEEIRELTQRLRTATERLNKANADAASSLACADRASPVWTNAPYLRQKSLNRSGANSV